MKNSICVLVFTGLTAWTLFMGCENTSDRNVKYAEANAKYAAQDMKDAQAAYVAKWQRFKRASERTIKANEIRIEAFKEKMEQGGPRFKARYNNEAAALEQRNRLLKMKLGEYRDGGRIKWEAFRTNFNVDIDGVGRSMTVLFKDDR